MATVLAFALVAASCAGRDGSDTGAGRGAEPDEASPSSTIDEPPGAGETEPTTSSATTPGTVSTATTETGDTAASNALSSAEDAGPIGGEPGPVAWAACGSRVECGTVAVPLDHDRPEGPTIDLALVRIPAAGEATGSIFVNPGGPGSSGVEFVRAGFRLDPDTMDRFHLVGFDPRGVGGSAPLGCRIERADGPLPDLSPDHPAEVGALDTEARAVAEACIGTDGPRLEFLGTDSVVRDLELLRVAVGDEKLHYFGFSYGTLIGLRYARAHPTTIGHMVLDGVVDPTLDLAGLLRQQAIAFETQFEVMDAACGTRLRCPEGGIIAGFERLRARLERDGPLGPVGTAELELTTLTSLYSDELWNQYSAALIDAEAGDPAPIDGLYGLLAAGTDYGAYAAVSCFDTPHPEGAAEWDALARELATVAPRFGEAVANEIRACAFWPENVGIPPGPVTAPGSAPILVIGTTGDAATPVENARRVASALDNAALIVAEGDRHTAYGRNQCVRNAVRDYFSPGWIPTEDTSC